MGYRFDGRVEGFVKAVAVTERELDAELPLSEPQAVVGLSSPDLRHCPRSSGTAAKLNPVATLAPHNKPVDSTNSTTTQLLLARIRVLTFKVRCQRRNQGTV